MQDDRLKSDDNVLHVNIKDDKLVARRVAMELAIQGAGSMLLVEQLVLRAKMIYDFISEGKIPEEPSASEPVLTIN
jgi:hypothetical protein